MSHTKHRISYSDIIISCTKLVPCLQVKNHMAKLPNCTDIRNVLFWQMYIQHDETENKNYCSYYMEFYLAYPGTLNSSWDHWTKRRICFIKFWNFLIRRHHFKSKTGFKSFWWQTIWQTDILSTHILKRDLQSIHLLAKYWGHEYVGKKMHQQNYFSPKDFDWNDKTTQISALQIHVYYACWNWQL